MNGAFSIMLSHVGRAFKAGRTAGLIAVLISATAGGAVAVPETHSFQAGENFRDCSDCPEMVVLPAGGFAMGSAAADTIPGIQSLPKSEAQIARIAFENEQPQHSVSIGKPVAVSKYLVTRGEFAAFIRDTSYSINGDCTVWVDHELRKIADANWQNPGFAQMEREPVVCVNWRDAQAYVAWLNRKVRGPATTTGDDPYHLPSEAEWEYAARGGTRTARWWGESIGSGNADCDGCGSVWDKTRTAPVGSFRPNPFGLYDMLGNVWEWTQDCWNESYAGAPDDGSPWRIGDGERRVIRGGGWISSPWLLRSASRTRYISERRGNYIGFRVAKLLP